MPLTSLLVRETLPDADREAKLVALAASHLANVLHLAPAHFAPLIRWVASHPATTTADHASYRAKFQVPPLTRADLPATLAEPLQDLLEDYVLGLPETVLEVTTPTRACRLLGVNRERLLERLRDAVSPAPSIAASSYGRAWWVAYRDHPNQVDLIDRRQFLRVAHVTNLYPTLEPPHLALPVPVESPFAPRSLMGWHNRQRERDETGQFVTDW